MAKVEDSKPQTLQELESMEFRGLITRKMILEILALDKKMQEPKVDFLGKVLRFFKTYIGRIVTIATIIAGVVAPIMNYVAEERKGHLIEVSSTILEILDSAKLKSQTTLMKVSTQDPNVAAPILLNHLNSNPEKAEMVKKIYAKMYEINTELSDYGWRDKILFFFVKDNKEILEDELAKNARRQFESVSPTTGLTILKAYLDMIYILQLQQQSDFKRALNILREKCGPKEYEDICGYMK